MGRWRELEERRRLVGGTGEVGTGTLASSSITDITEPAGPGLSSAEKEGKRGWGSKEGRERRRGRVRDLRIAQRRWPDEES